jgi:hypothetical protein
MTRTEERLADALGAAARAVRDDTLRPLLIPARRRRHRSLAVSLAAAAAVLLVAGLAVATTRYLPGHGQTPSPATAPPLYYVEAGLGGGPPVVRSTTTGAKTATVRVPGALAPYVVTAAAHGTFFTVAGGSSGLVIYRFRLSAGGLVEGLSRVRAGGHLGGQWSIGAFAASPDGSQLAIALLPANGGAFVGLSPSGCGNTASCASSQALSSGQDEQIDVLNTRTGAASVWKGGTGNGYSFTVTNLSWTSSGNELVYYGEWCPDGGGGMFEACAVGTGTGGAKAEVWALDPTLRGGKLTSGRRLFQLSAAYPYLPQAVISPDGQSITAVAVTGPSSGTDHLAVEQISVPSGRRLSVAYTRDVDGSSLGSVTLSPDGSGQNWLLSGTICTPTGKCSGGFNGWIDRGRLIPLQPAREAILSEAW